MIVAELLRPPLSLDGLKADWERLYRSSGREPSVSFEWSRGILQNHLAGRDDWFIAVLRRGGQVAGIVPMLTSRERLFGRPGTLDQRKRRMQAVPVKPIPDRKSVLAAALARRKAR